MTGTIMIVDYGTSNIQSVHKTLVRTGVRAIVSNDPKDIERADKIILPGIGHFGHAMRNLHRLGLLASLHEAVLIRRKPVLGICLGMQLMADESMECEEEKGLGWIKGRVAKLTVINTLRYKIPHIGWNNIQIVKPGLLMNGVDPDSEFYFTHSYHFMPAGNNVVLNTSDYGGTFVSAIEQDNIYGVQYHPEKSHAAGSLLLKNFAAI